MRRAFLAGLEKVDDPVGCSNPVGRNAHGGVPGREILTKFGALWLLPPSGAEALLRYHRLRVVSGITRVDETGRGRKS